MADHVHCNDMKLGEVYACTSCGLELKVVKTCDHEGHDKCCDACADGSSDCTFSCCGQVMGKK